MVFTLFIQVEIPGLEVHANRPPASECFSYEPRFFAIFEEKYAFLFFGWQALTYQRQVSVVSHHMSDQDHSTHMDIIRVNKTMDSLLVRT